MSLSTVGIKTISIETQNLQSAMFNRDSVSCLLHWHQKEPFASLKRQQIQTWLVITLNHRCTFYSKLKHKQESCAIAKMTAQCALHMGALKIFGTPWLRPRPLFPTFSWAFFPIDPMNVSTKFEVRNFTRSWDNRGYPKNLGSPWIRPRFLFSKIFNGLLFG